MTNSYLLKKTSANFRLFKGKRPTLTHLDIELTERCNNNCIHCFINLPADDVNAKSRELGTDQWVDILNQAADLGALSVRFTGGEPLLREDFSDLYLHARQLGMKVVIFTNARFITKELADLFSQVPPLRKIEVSVYGMHAKSYDAVARSPGAFHEFRRGVNLLLEKEIPFAVKSVLLPINRGEMEEFENWADTIPGMGSPSYSVNLDFRARRDLPEKNKIIKKMRFTPEETVNLISLNGEVYCQDMAQFSEKFLHPQGDHLFSCGSGLNGCVDAYGKYQMCLLLRHPDTVYDLTKGTLREGRTEVFPQIRKLKAKNSSYLARCAKCFLKGLCLQCPARSWMEHGTLDTPVEYLCQIAHAQAEYLGLLEEGEKSWEIDDWQERIGQFVKRELGHEYPRTQEPQNG